MVNKIFNCDCLDGMKKIPDGSIDFILCDPPFGSTDCDWDIRIPFEPMWEQFKRVTKENAAIAIFSQLPFGSDLIQSNKKMFRYEWIWEKSVKTGFLNAKKMPLKKHENILIFYRKLPTYNPQKYFDKPYKPKDCQSHSKNYKIFNVKIPEKYLNYQHGSPDGSRYPYDILRFNSLLGREPMFHPTQKPTDLLEYLIKTYTNEGETVLDATIGSGSTAVAAINTNRNFIGFEIDKNYFEIAQKRIEKALAEKQQRLF